MGYPINYPVGPGNDKSVFTSSKFRKLDFVKVAEELEKKGLDVIGLSTDSDSGFTTITLKKDETRSEKEIDVIVQEAIKSKTGKSGGYTISHDGLGQYSVSLPPKDAKLTAQAKKDNTEQIDIELN